MRDRAVQETEAEFEKSAEIATRLSRENDEHWDTFERVTGSWKNRALATVIPGFMNATPAYDARIMMDMN